MSNVSSATHSETNQPIPPVTAWLLVAIFGSFPCLYAIPAPVTCIFATCTSVFMQLPSVQATSPGAWKYSLIWSCNQNASNIRAAMLALPGGAARYSTLTQDPSCVYLLTCGTFFLHISQPLALPGCCEHLLSPSRTKHTMSQTIGFLHKSRSRHPACWEPPTCTSLPSTKAPSTPHPHQTLQSGVQQTAPQRLPSCPIPPPDCYPIYQPRSHVLVER